MSLSNTATPKYYAEFRDAVIRGDFPVNKEISMEMNRIDKLIADPSIYCDNTAVDGFINFSNDELTLTNGDDLEVLPIFKVWAEQIFCWYYFADRPVYEEPTPLSKGGWSTQMVKLRLTVKQYLIVARGAAKSMYISMLQAYFLNCDTDTTHHITVAPTMKQADEVMSPIRTAIVRARGPYFKYLTFGALQNTTGDPSLRQKLVSTKRGIENKLTGSVLEVRPMTVDKLQSLRTKYNTVDEWLSTDVREDVVGAIEQGASKNDEYLIVAVSSEGTVRNGSGDTIKMELARILNPENEYNPQEISIWHYKLDHQSEVAKTEMWRKANPNIGLTVAYEVIEREAKRAEQAPQTRNEFLAKRMGIPMEGFTYFFTYEETIPFVRRPRAFRGVPCALGADLSQGDDFCAFTWVFPLPRERFGIKARSYITTKTLDNLPGAYRAKYQEFIDEGTLVVMEGTILDMTQVTEDLLSHIRLAGYDIRAMGYDVYNSEEFLDLYTREYGSYAIEKVAQGARTESVPLGEMKKLATERMVLFDEEIMKYTMGNCVVIQDTNNNIKLSKLRTEDKIDNVSAWMDGYIAYKKFKEAF